MLDALSCGKKSNQARFRAAPGRSGRSAQMYPDPGLTVDFARLGPCTLRCLSTLPLLPKNEIELMLHFKSDILRLAPRKIRALKRSRTALCCHKQTVVFSSPQRGILFGLEISVRGGRRRAPRLFISRTGLYRLVWSITNGQKSDNR